MSAWAWAVILKPLGALLIFGGICLPIRMLIHKYMPDGWLKYQILKTRSGTPDRFTSDYTGEHPSD